MAFSLADLKKPEFRGKAPQLPLCLLLGETALFIKQDDLKLCGWVDKSINDRIQSALEANVLAKLAKGKKTDKVAEPEVGSPSAGIPHVHTYNKGEVSGGLRFPAPRMNILGTSPRLVQVTTKGEERGLGRKGKILANYEFEDGQRLYHDPSNAELLSLSTLHMIYLCGDDNKPLHKVPLVLSLHGSVAAIFGKQLELFYRMLEVAVTNQADDGQFYSLNEKARVTAIFCPKFGIESVGKEDTSNVCSVESFIEPEAETIEQHFNWEQADVLWGSRESLGEFAAHYMNQFEQYHQIAPGVDLDRFPSKSANSAILPYPEDEFPEMSLPYQGMTADGQQPY